MTLRFFTWLLCSSTGKVTLVVAMFAILLPLGLPLWFVIAESVILFFMPDD